MKMKNKCSKCGSSCKSICLLCVWIFRRMDRQGRSTDIKEEISVRSHLIEIEVT